MRFLAFLGLFLVIFTFSRFSVVQAETVLRMSDSVSLAADQVVKGDFYGFSGITGPVSLSGNIEGDAYVFGTSVTANGEIEGDVFVIGGSAQIHASVTDDVRVVGGEVTIAEYVGGDIFVLGGTLKVLSSSNIDGNVFFFGGSGLIEGNVGGSIFGTYEDLRIDAVVAGGVDVKVSDSLVIGDRSDIGGDIRYESRNEIVRAQNSVVVGDVVKNSEKLEPLNPKEALIPLLIYAFSSLIVFVIFRKRLLNFLISSQNSFKINFLVGVAGAIFLPAVISFLFVTIIGSVIGLLGLSALLSLYIYSCLLVGVFLGFLLKIFFTKSKGLTLMWTLLGIMVTEILVLIPIVGPLVVFTLGFILLGSVLRSIYYSLT